MAFATTVHWRAVTGFCDPYFLLATSSGGHSPNQGSPEELRRCAHPDYFGRAVCQMAGAAEERSAWQRVAAATGRRAVIIGRMSFHPCRLSKAFAASCFASGTCTGSEGGVQRIAEAWKWEA